MLPDGITFDDVRSAVCLDAVMTSLPLELQDRIFVEATSGAYIPRRTMKEVLAKRVSLTLPPAGVPPEGVEMRRNRKAW
jgi:hypothetical protein